MDRLDSLARTAHPLHRRRVPLWTFTLIAGAIWAISVNCVLEIQDPKEVWLTLIWTVYAGYLHARATTGVRRQSVAWIALAGFGCIILNYTVVNMFLVGMHSYSGL